MKLNMPCLTSVWDHFSVTSGVVFSTSWEIPAGGICFHPSTCRTSSFNHVTLWLHHCHIAIVYRWPSRKFGGAFQWTWQDFPFRFLYTFNVCIPLKSHSTTLNPKRNHHFPMVFHGFPIKPLFSYGFPIVFLCFLVPLCAGLLVQWKQLCGTFESSRSGIQRERSGLEKRTTPQLIWEAIGKP